MLNNKYNTKCNNNFNDSMNIQSSDFNLKNSLQDNSLNESKLFYNKHIDIKRNAIVEVSNSSSSSSKSNNSCSDY